MDQLMFGQIFNKVADFLKMYSNYCSNQQKSLGTIKRMKETNEPFQILIATQSTKPESKNQNLESFLIKPIQRICKYPLLLREVIKFTDPTHPDYESLNLAFEKINKIVEQINLTTKQRDNKTKIEEIQRNTEGIEELNVDSNVTLVKEGPINYGNSKGWGLLFDTQFAFTKKKKLVKGEKTNKLKLIIKVQSIQYQRSIDENSFEIVADGKKYTFVVPASAMQKEWLEAFGKTKMSLKEGGEVKLKRAPTN